MIAQIQAQVDSMVSELKATFSGWPASLKSEADEAAYKAAFIKAVIQFKVNSKVMIQRGMKVAREKAAKGERFLPSGATFAGWCMPSPAELGIQEFEYAYKRVLDRDWESIHPAFAAVCRSSSVQEVQRMRPDCDPESPVYFDKPDKVSVPRYDLYEMRRARPDRSRQMFQAIYDEVVRRVSSGERFEPVQSLPYTRSNPTGVKVAGRDRGNTVLKSLLGDMRARC